ncbi:glycophorin-C isoform X3 [Tachysurus fulvidraco]|uniref:glycophorin-C isoform X3 n=1 Tax=Tachysurus fulvidraco TaxID=1234273 RepID=UPI000F4FEBC4|nr:glycophorin-C isoform X3 [Tachysurus fulvidraco]XP_027008193.1 glycophorin-C isoform X3 [Tachysurus fulvidraco]XP_047670703.1 glycophorin-C isoform X3 [Tachysurus fulvidraco]
MLLRPDSTRMASNTTGSITPALKNEGASPVTEGAADENGSYFNVIIGAVIAAVVLVFICLLLVLFRYMYRHKGTYHTNEAKGSEFAETADAALQGDPALQDAVDESKKEYFI